MDELSQVIAQYGIYAVFVLCMVEGDITLLLSGALAHSSFFGDYSLLKLIIIGTLGGMTGDTLAYGIGRIFQQKAKHYRFYEMARPRVDRLIDKFGAFALVISKYIYGIRVAICVFYGIGKMPFGRFLFLDAISCTLWVTLLSGAGYFFSGAITTVIGDFHQLGIVVVFVIVIAVIILYSVERFWLSARVEKADPETIHKIEETLHAVEGAAQGKLHNIGERLHLTRDQDTSEQSEIEPEPPEEKPQKVVPTSAKN